MTRTLTIFGFLAVAAVLGGCQASSEFDGKTYRHNGMDFSVEVPEGWTWSEPSGNLLVAISAPANDGPRPVVHVFSRREVRTVELGDASSGLIKELLEVMAEEVNFQLEAEALPAVVAVELSDLPAAEARRVSRIVHEGPVEVYQELTVVASGKQVWALMLSIPTADRDGVKTALDQLRNSFRVW